MPKVRCKFQNGRSKCVIVQGDGRDLSFVPPNFLHAIITDHPWRTPKCNNGGNRLFSNYECFEYTLDDFKEKARVLRQGCFLVEIIPAENAENFRYLYTIKDLAEKAGFLYYAKVPWKKGTFVSNTGRKSKNTEDILFFSKGKARALRPDVKKNLYSSVECFMSGTAGMLPTNFDIQPVSRQMKIHQSEKPVELYKQILSFVALKGEIILDQFAGSGALGVSCLESDYQSILIEKNSDTVDKMIRRFNNAGYNVVES